MSKVIFLTGEAGHGAAPANAAQLYPAKSSIWLSRP
jgi:hypothetical protein